MTFTRTVIAAYLADALDPDEAQALEAQAAVDPGLARRIQRVRTLLEGEGRSPGRPAKGRTERLHVRISPDARAWVRDEATRLSQSEADVVEALIYAKMGDDQDE